MEVKTGRTGTTVYDRIVYQEQNRKVCCDIAPGFLLSVATRAANRLPGTAIYTPSFLESCRPLEKEESKNGRSLVHFSVPSSLAIWRLRGCTSCLAPSRAPSNHAAAESNLILPGGRGGQPMRHSSDRIGQGEGINCCKLFAAKPTSVPSAALL